MRLKRLVSAVLAVGMALTILPTAAFATSVSEPTGTPITSLKFDSNGKPEFVPGEGEYDPSQDDLSGTYYYPSKSQAQWAMLNTRKSIWIATGYSFNGAGEQAIREGVSVSGIINGGIYDWGVAVNPSGAITNGIFQTCTNKGRIYGGIFYNDVNSTEGEVYGGLFKEEPANIKSNYYKIEAEGCTISGQYKNTEFSYMESICLVDTSNIKITVKPASAKRKVTKWNVEGISSYVDDGQSITFTVPMNETGKVKITAELAKVDLAAANNLPTDESQNNDGTYGSKLDGWQYKETVDDNKINKDLTIYQGYTANIDDEQVDWAVQNNGTIASGKYTGKVNNYGNIIGGTYTGAFSNRNAVEDKNTNATGEGIVTSGVFSRSADFGTQNPDITWLTVKNNATINGIKDFTMAGIVGEQSVTITAPTGFKCWSVSGDSDLTLTEEQKHSNPLVLDLKGTDKSNIILTAQSEEGYYPLNLTDGKAYSVTADGAKDKEITAARAGDTVILEADATLIPDGMVFDRWEITGDTELTGGFDANAEKTQFTMPNGSVTIRAMYRMADVEEPNVLGTVAVIGTVAVGGAVIAWQGYNIAADIYARDILPEGTAIPETKEALAVMLWQNAGKPEVVAVDGTALSETEQAQQWVVANGLMENEEDGSFHPEKGVGKFAALNTIKAQSEAKVSE